MRFLETADPLTRSDFDTRTWARLRLLLAARLQLLREENDSGDDETTARRRGRIAEIKELLALEDEIRQPWPGDAAR
jgi:hypothetical protein